MNNLVDLSFIYKFDSFNHIKQIGGKYNFFIDSLIDGKLVKVEDNISQYLNELLSNKSTFKNAGEIIVEKNGVTIYLKKDGSGFINGMPFAKSEKRLATKGAPAAVSESHTESVDPSSVSASVSASHTDSLLQSVDSSSVKKRMQSFAVSESPLPKRPQTVSSVVLVPPSAISVSPYAVSETQLPKRPMRNVSSAVLVPSSAVSKSTSAKPLQLPKRRIIKLSSAATEPLYADSELEAAPVRNIVTQEHDDVKHYRDMINILNLYAHKLHNKILEYIHDHQIDKIYLYDYANQLYGKPGWSRDFIEIIKQKVETGDEGKKIMRILLKPIFRKELSSVPSEETEISFERWQSRRQSKPKSKPKQDDIFMEYDRINDIHTIHIPTLYKDLTQTSGLEIDDVLMLLLAEYLYREGHSVTIYTNDNFLPKKHNNICINESSEPVACNSDVVSAIKNAIYDFNFSIITGNTFNISLVKKKLIKDLPTDQSSVASADDRWKLEEGGYHHIYFHHCY